MSDRIFRKLTGLPKPPSVLMIGFVLTLWMLGGCVLEVSFDCPQRDSSIPQHPIYPNARLVGQITVTDSDGYEELRYNYETRDDPSQVVDFYSGKAFCVFSPSANQTLCDGQATPFGNYWVAIKHTENTITSYYVKVYWDKCNGGFD